MYILYLDDAGSVGNPNEKHFILGGLCIFERQIHWLANELEKVAASSSHPQPETLELHGNQIFAGRKFWRSVQKPERSRIIRHGLAAARALKGDWCLFGVVVDKIERSPEDPIEYAFEQLCNRFDRFLQRKHRQNNSQRGIIVLDKSTRETRLQSMATEFRSTGHRWGKTRNLADVPFFVDSAATRAVQYADLVAYALWRNFEKGDTQFFDVISDSFDREGRAVHGLHHYKEKNLFCDCPACAPLLI